MMEIMKLQFWGIWLISIKIELDILNIFIYILTPKQNKALPQWANKDSYNKH